MNLRHTLYSVVSLHRQTLFSSNIFCNAFIPFSIAAYPAHRATGRLEPIPAILGRRRATPQTGRQFITGLTHREINNHLHSHSHLRKVSNSPNLRVFEQANPRPTQKGPSCNRNLEPSCPIFLLCFMKFGKKKCLSNIIRVKFSIDSHNLPSGVNANDRSLQN